MLTCLDCILCDRLAQCHHVRAGLGIHGSISQCTVRTSTAAAISRKILLLVVVHTYPLAAHTYMAQGFAAWCTYHRLLRGLHVHGIQHDIGQHRTRVAPSCCRCCWHCCHCCRLAVHPHHLLWLSAARDGLQNTRIATARQRCHNGCSHMVWSRLTHCTSLTNCQLCI